MTSEENNQTCFTCNISLIRDDNGVLMAVETYNESEPEKFFCYKCHFREEDEKQSQLDDEEARRNGFIEINGRWIKKKVIRKKYQKS